MKYVINVLNYWVNILNIMRMIWIIQKKNKCFKEVNSLFLLLGLSITRSMFCLLTVECWFRLDCDGLQIVKSPLLNNITRILERHLYNQNIQNIPLIHTFFWSVISGSVAISSSLPMSVLVGGQNGFENSYFIWSNVKFSCRSTFIDNNGWLRGLVICPITLSICSLFGFRWPHFGEGRFRSGGGIGDNDGSRFGDTLGAREWRHTLGESTYKNSICNKKLSLRLNV